MSARREAFEAWRDNWIGNSIESSARDILERCWQAAYLQGEAAGVRRCAEILDNVGEVCLTCNEAHKDAIKAALPQHFDSSSTS